ncbi:MAG: alpha/beta fold hydrolase [Bdellovibrionales bacterium]|nr:alpha/beta fold hydrolase [Bdellovibrionales bacterium]
MSELWLVIAAGAVVFIGLVLLFRRRRPAFVPFADTEVRSADVDGWKIRYLISGRGPYLLLVHGIGANLFCWRFIAPLLAQHFTVVAFDLPGFGQSSALPGAAYGLDDQVPRVKSFMDKLGIRQAYVVGNSMGGNIALWLSLLHPERVLGCAVIAPATSRRLVPMSVRHLAWMAPPLSLLLTRQAMGWAHRRTVSKRELVDADRIEETFRTYGRSPQAVRSFLLATEAIRDPRLPSALAALKIPLLILWGSRDRLVMRQVIDELESAVEASESHVHMGGGHHLQEDEPEWVTEKLLAFFTVLHD